MNSFNKWVLFIFSILSVVLPSSSFELKDITFAIFTVGLFVVEAIEEKN